MSITLEGSLRIKRINGANGPFCVGDLYTELGDFRVKDSVLDQFEEGVYDGRFAVSRIFPWSYSANGRMVLEVRAKLLDLQINTGNEQAIPEGQAEPDPADEPTASPPVEAASAATVDGHDGQQAGSDDSAPATGPSDEALFGEELYPLVAARQPVKLDPSIDDRRQFRQQRDRLKLELDYGFIAEHQAWYPTESEAYKAYLASRA